MDIFLLVWRQQICKICKLKDKFTCKRIETIQKRNLTEGKAIPIVFGSYVILLFVYSNK